MLETLEARRMLVIPGTTLGAWDSYSTLEAELASIHSAYPNLTELVSIGKSVQNRDIWAMRITDHPTLNEDEPEFFYNGPMHGDETVGVELSFYFIQHLLESYGRASGDGPRVTNLVDNMDIWVVPSMNPDGYTRSPKTRGNANGVDLNRNFPEWTTRDFGNGYTVRFGPYGNMFDDATAGVQPDLAGIQPETRAIIDFRRSRHFVASATLHGGEVIANYPWDSNGNAVADHARTPDHKLFEQLALTYARHNPTMFAQNNAAEGFVNGTVNGDRWYPITGGAQDWALIYTGAFELTLELSFNKNPAADTLAGYWAENRESMLSYLEAANWGVRGVLTRTTDGAPVFGKVTVIAPAPSQAPDPNHPTTLPVYSDRENGDFHRLLLPGTYTLRFEAPGYQPRTISGIEVDALTTDPTQTLRLSRQSVALTPLDTTRPVVTSAGFVFESAAQVVRFGFSEPVAQDISSAALELRNDTTGRIISSTSLGVSYTADGEGAFFSSTAGPLANGNYTALLQPGSVRDAWGNPLSGDASASFFVLAGDANRDRQVDVDDFSALALRFNRPGAFAQGDFDYDGQVAIDDFSILAAAFNTSLPAARSTPPAAATVQTVMSVSSGPRWVWDVLGEETA